MDTVQELKQYFTPPALADFMVKLVPNDNISTVIDLSMGECDLLTAAQKRWKAAEYFGVDIDIALVEQIKESFPYIHVFNGDSLKEELLNSWHEYMDVINAGGFDFAIANPPFDFRNQEEVLIEKNKKVSLPVEMRFLLKYINIVKDGGYLCIILPYGFLSLDLYTELRKIVLERVRVHKIIKIFKQCFNGIDADTCLLLLQKKKADKNIQTKFIAESLTSKYSLVKPIDIILESENNRMDIEYHQLKGSLGKLENYFNFPVSSLNKFTVSCKRGRSITTQKKLVVETGCRFIHTTDVHMLYISDDNAKYVIQDTGYFDTSIVQKETILIGRVGNACIGKVAIYDSDSTSAFSDCLFALNVKDIDPYYLSLYLASKYGQLQLKGIIKGSCSKYITKKDILSLKIIFPEEDLQADYRARYINILSTCHSMSKERALQNLVNELESLLVKE